MDIFRKDINDREILNIVSDCVLRDRLNCKRKPLKVNIIIQNQKLVPGYAISKKGNIYRKHGRSIKRYERKIKNNKILWDAYVSKYGHLIKGKNKYYNPG